MQQMQLDNSTQRLLKLSGFRSSTNGLADMLNEAEIKFCDLILKNSKGRQDISLTLVGSTYLTLGKHFNEKYT